MSMYDTARSLRLQEQQRRTMAKQGTWPDASSDDSVVRKIKSMMAARKKH